MPVRAGAHRNKGAAKKGHSRGFWNPTRDDGSTGTMRSRLTLAQKEELRSCYRSFDKDGSGWLERNEIKQALIMTGVASSDADVTKFIKKIDTGGDGRVSEDEFIEFMAKQYLHSSNIREEMDMAMQTIRMHCSDQRMLELRKLHATQVGDIATMIMQGSPDKSRTRAHLLKAWKDQTVFSTSTRKLQMVDFVPELDSPDKTSKRELKKSRTLGGRAFSRSSKLSVAEVSAPANLQTPSGKVTFGGVSDAKPASRTGSAVRGLTCAMTRTFSVPQGAPPPAEEASVQEELSYTPPLREAKLAAATDRWRRSAVAVRPGLRSYISASNGNGLFAGLSPARRSSLGLRDSQSEGRRTSQGEGSSAGISPALAAALAAAPTNTEHLQARKALFRLSLKPLPRKLAVKDEYIDLELLRLFLQDAGSEPLSAKEFATLVGMADPLGTGRVRFADLKKLECFTVKDDPVLFGVDDEKEPPPEMLYAAVPPGVAGGDVITLETIDGHEVTVEVPQGLSEGDTFCYDSRMPTGAIGQVFDLGRSAALSAASAASRVSGMAASALKGSAGFVPGLGRASSGSASGSSMAGTPPASNAAAATAAAAAAATAAAAADAAAHDDVEIASLMAVRQSVKLDVETRRSGTASPDAIEVEVSPALKSSMTSPPSSEALSRAGTAPKGSLIVERF